jgi:hypothetical protein
MFDANSFVHSFSDFSNIQWDDDHYWNAYGIKTHEDNSSALNGLIRVNPGERYRFYVDEPGYLTTWMFANFFSTPIEYVTRDGFDRGSGNSITFTIPDGVYYMTLSGEELKGHTSNIRLEKL